MGPVFELDLDLPKRGSRQRTRSLHQQLRLAIIEGRLKAGVRLPGSRALASQVAMTRNAVVAVYDLLLSEGYVTTRRGGGTYVAQIASSRRPAKPAPPEFDTRLAPAWREADRVIRFSRTSQFTFDFGVGMPDPGAFPFAVWRSLVARSLRASEKSPSSYADPEGRPALREAIAGHVSFVRAVACSADDVVVTSGAQQAFDLLARVLTTPGKTVAAVENPGYSPLHRAFETAGARLAGVPVDDEGLCVERLPPTAKVVCVTPSHQFPLGPAMSMRRRVELLQFAQKHQAVVIEDDYDGEFRYLARPLDALQTLDRQQCVIYVGTFSKSMLPELRMGYVVAPPWCRAALIAAKQRSDWHSEVMVQDALASFIAEGHLARHVRRMRAIYAGRRAELLRCLQRWCAPTLQPLPSVSGLHVAALLHGKRDSVSICEAAERQRIRLTSTAWFSVDQTKRARVPDGLVFGLGPIAEERIERAIKQVARLIE